MPRPEQTPTAAYKTGTTNPYGFAEQVNSMAETVAEQEEFPAFAATEDGPSGEPEFQPAGEEEAFLFSPTDRPDEPITAGVPFGAGADFSRFSYESDTQFMGRVSKQLEADPSQEVQEFRRLIAKGL